MSGRHSISTPPPSYKESMGGYSYRSSGVPYSDAFTPTSQLQIAAVGYDMNQALCGRTLEQISVYRAGTGKMEYLSVRTKKSSNSCALVRANDGRATPLISTIYRWGPGRNPRMRLINSIGLKRGISVEEAIDDGNVRGEQVNVKSRSMVSRSQIFDTSLGHLEWRYGTRDEHKTAHADSLMVLERTDHVALPDGRKSRSGTVVAHFIRNDEYRDPNSVKYSGGNGGRLMIDLRIWEADQMTSPGRVEAFVTASCILMMKREADRFINNNMAIVV